jgi:NADH dehydrogenase FAD-containing subunit
MPIATEKEKQESNGEARKESISKSNNSNKLTKNGTNTAIYDHVTRIRESVDQHWNSGEVTQHVEIHTLAWKLGMSISPLYYSLNPENPLKYNLPKVYYNPDFL